MPRSSAPPRLDRRGRRPTRTAGVADLRECLRPLRRTPDGEPGRVGVDELRWFFVDSPGGRRQRSARLSVADLDRFRECPRSVCERASSTRCTSGGCGTATTRCRPQKTAVSPTAPGVGRLVTEVLRFDYSLFGSLPGVLRGQRSGSTLAPSLTLAVTRALTPGARKIVAGLPMCRRRARGRRVQGHRVGCGRRGSDPPEIAAAATQRLRPRGPARWGRSPFARNTTQSPLASRVSIANNASAINHARHVPRLKHDRKENLMPLIKPRAHRFVSCVTSAGSKSRTATRSCSTRGSSATRPTTSSIN